MQSTEDVNSVSAEVVTVTCKVSTVELLVYPRRIIPSPAGEPGQ